MRDVKPHVGQYIILGDTFTFVIRNTQIYLTRAIPLFSRRPIPTNSRFSILWNTKPFGKKGSQIVLGLSITLFSCLLIKCRSFRKILCNSEATPIYIPERKLGINATQSSGTAVPFQHFLET